MSDDRFYWCRRHDRVERAGEACGELYVLGPYPSPDAARNWRQLRDAREERWEAQDEAWKRAGRKRSDESEQS